jgi:hypothetical protein
MKYNIYSMKDDLNGFMNFFPEISDEVAVRGFSHALACADPNSLFYTNPADYSLYALGTFDTDSGTIEVYPAPRFLIRGEKR